MFLPATPSLLTANRTMSDYGCTLATINFQIFTTTSSISAFGGLKILEVDRGGWKFVNYIKEVKLNKWKWSSLRCQWDKSLRSVFFVVCFIGIPLFSFKTSMNCDFHLIMLSHIYTEMKTFYIFLAATVTTLCVAQYVFKQSQWLKTQSWVI